MKEEAADVKISVFDPIARLQGAGEMEFLDLAGFDGGGAGAFWSEPGGTSPWEMHPDCDELLQILEGEIEVEVLPPGADPGSVVRVPAGSFVVIPRGCWHRQTILQRTREFYLTPGPTLHSGAEDPRADSADTG